MKRLIAASAIALITATGASAMTLDRGANVTLIQKFAPDADVSQLSDSTIAHVLSIIHDDGDMSLSSVQQQVRAAIKAAQQ